MDIKTFENLKVTTMTVIISLKGLINLDPTFILLPISKVDTSGIKKLTKKLKLPKGNPGDVLSLRYKGSTRGFNKGSASSAFFKNSITVDLSIIDKNLSMKISANKLQMCGVSSINQVKEAIGYLISHLKTIQEEIDYIKSNLTETKTIITEIKNCNIHPERDKRIVRFLMSRREEVSLESDFHILIDYISNIPFIVSPDIGIEHIQTVMVNMNYDLGFKINRQALVECIDGVNGFYTRYNNSTEHNVTIELPYVPPENHQRGIRKKNKIPCHTFLIYPSGTVTQSGPSLELMHDVYYRFMETINDISQFVMKVEPLKKLKIRIKNPIA